MSAITALPASVQAILLLVASNCFMTMAWYGHLKNLASSPWYIAALISWGIALAEYLLQVPANRIGFEQAGFSVPFSMLYLGQPFKLDFVWAGLCMVGAAYFMFRG
ncbi:MAG: hypothetical protein EOO24_67570 [Comamonadaceae bacterium]|nr:MAG: hypothetical protein EOO24_67570 [Comamonadaceae bacterium]